MSQGTCARSSRADTIGDHLTTQLMALDPVRAVGRKCGRVGATVTVRGVLEDVPNHVFRLADRYGLDVLDRGTDPNGMGQPETLVELVDDDRREAVLEHAERYDRDVEIVTMKMDPEIVTDGGRDVPRIDATTVLSEDQEREIAFRNVFGEDSQRALAEAFDVGLGTISKVVKAYREAGPALERSILEEYGDDPADGDEPSVEISNREVWDGMTDNEIEHAIEEIVDEIGLDKTVAVLDNEQVATDVATEHVVKLTSARTCLGEQHALEAAHAAAGEPAPEPEPEPPDEPDADEAAEEPAHGDADEDVEPQVEVTAAHREAVLEEIAELVEAVGGSAGMALDYYACVEDPERPTVGRYSQNAWSDRRARSQQAISDSIRRAREELGR